jgi:hypothetical protein
MFCPLLAESVSAEALSLLTACHVKFHLCFELLQPSIGAFKITAHLQGCFMSVPFHHLSISAVLFFLAGKRAHLPYCHALLQKSSCVLKNHPLEKPAVQWNPIFFNMATVESGMPYSWAIFHVYLFYFCPLLS